MGKLESLAGKLWNKFRPYQFTVAFPLIGTLASQDLHINTSENLKVIFSMGLFGGLMDLVRAHYKHQKINRLRSHPSKIAKVFDIENFEYMIDSVKRYHGFSGDCTLAEAMGKQEGTGVLKGGYFTALKLMFDDGNEIRLFYKYNNSPGSDIGGEISNALNRQGLINFVPKTFTPDIGNSQVLFNVKPSTGQLYAWVEGDSLENVLLEGEEPLIDYSAVENIPAKKIFDAMFKIYSLDSPSLLSILEPKTNLTLSFRNKFKFHKDLAGNLYREKNDNLFVEALEKVFEESFSTADGLKLIHGDFHQGNILFEKDKLTGIIDWDSAQLGIPYQDFFHFAVITDFEKNSKYRETRDSFVKRQEKVAPGVTPEQMKLVEFETYLSLLNRYYKAVKHKNIKSEFNKNMMQSCKYLLEKSKSALSEYTQLTENFGLMQLYEDFAEQKFQKLKNVRFNPNASVAYAHRVNHKEQKKDVSDLALKNFSKHQDEIESFVVAETYAKSGYKAMIASTMLGAVGLFSHYSNQIISGQINDAEKFVLTFFGSLLAFWAGTSYLLYKKRFFKSR